MQTAFPSIYETAIDTYVGQSPHAANGLDRLLSDSALTLRQSRGRLSAQADAGDLQQLLDIQIRMTNALAGTDARLCADFFYGSSSPAFADFASRNRALAVDAALAALDAIVGGQAARIDRPPPSEEDFRQFETALAARGLNDAEVAALLDGRPPNPPLADARQCELGQIYLETLRALPEAPRLAIFAMAVALMARS